MQINLKKLQSMGFHTDVQKDSKGDVLEIQIYPRDCKKDAEELISKEFELRGRYAFEVMETIHELQIIQALRET